VTELLAELQRTLGDSYRIERELGGGGMSRVFVAHETALGRAVVVKILTPELAAGVSAERFAREVKVAARLQQANIVPVLSTGDANGIPWYSMPYVRGESLRSKLSLGGQMPITDAIHILRDVARALAFAHGEGVVHRDIKPENILLSGGAAVVTDFGIAKALTSSRTLDGGAGITITQLGTSIGTPAYMAPEQAAGDPAVDHRADIYAWGIVAWELIAGKHPFAVRMTPQALLAAHLSETPARLVTVRADVPRALASLVARSLEKDPMRRPQSATQLLAALDQIGTASGARDLIAEASSVPAKKLAMIAAGVAVIALGGWYAVHRSAPTAAGGGAGKSLAVLPFESVGGDTANVYFAEGMADELTTALGKVTGLRVAATSSAFSYRNKAADVREVGKALNVAAVLQGRVRREGARMRVSAQLSNAADGLVLWSNSYEREIKDVFTMQDEITRDIVGALRVTLAGGARPSAPVANKDTTDVDTYDLYLRGLYFLQARGGGVPRAIGYFRQALARDSTFARAWAELGMAYAVWPLFSPVPVDSVLGLARAAVANAHRLDSTNAAAYAVEGMTHLLASDWQAAGPSFERAIALDSTYAMAHRANTAALYQSGRTEESVAEARRTERLDPLSPLTHAVATIVLLNVDRRQEALATARRAIELDSSVAGFAHLTYSLAVYASGNTDSARKLLKGAGRVSQTTPWMGYLIGATGSRADAAAFIRQLDTERGHNSFTNIAQAWTYLGMGDTTRALDALERAMRAREPIGFAVPFGMPMYDPIRHSARLVAVIKGYGLNPAAFRVSP